MNEMAQYSPERLNRIRLHLTVTRCIQWSLRAENQTLAENVMLGHQNVWVSRLNFV